MDKFPHLSSERLTLQELSAKDIPLIIAYAGNIKVAESTLNIPHPYQEKYWNKGYATEATQAVLNFGFFKLKLNKIYATHILENLASGKVMVKNNMIREGVLKDHTKNGDVYRSLVQYRLTKNEFLK